MELNPAGGQSQVVFPRARYWIQFCFITISQLTENTELSGSADLLEVRKALLRHLDKLD